MSAEGVALVRKIYGDFARGDVAAVLAAMADDIVWNEAENFPYADKNPYVGPRAVAEGVFARCASEWIGFACEAEEILDAGDAVIALGRYAGVWKATGKRMHPQFAHVWRIRNGKAQRFQQYADTLGVFRAVS